MVVIHISGATGSGKTYIGLMMKKIYPDAKLHVVDLDAIFNKAIHHDDGPAAPDKKFAQIEKYILDFVKRTRARYRNILFTGYSDVMIDGVVRYIDLHADDRYFIKIPFKQLAQQYRWRASQHIVQTRNKTTVFSDADLQRILQKDLKIYAKFKPMSQEQIIQAIILRIGK